MPRSSATLPPAIRVGFVRPSIAGLRGHRCARCFARRSCPEEEKSCGENNDQKNSNYSQTMVLTVHHLGISQSERIVWLCEALGIQYNLKVYKRAPLFSPPEYSALHPIGAAPVIEDGDVKIAESEACVEYIVNIYGGGKLTVKPGAKNYPEYLYWYVRHQRTIIS